MVIIYSKIRLPLKSAKLFPQAAANTWQAQLAMAVMVITMEAEGQVD